MAFSARLTDTGLDVRSQLAQIENKIIIGTNGKKYKIVACVLRNTAGTWAMLNDAGHTPVGVASVSMPNTYTIRITYDFTAAKVGSLVCAPDEVYIQNGIQFGATVGLEYSDIVVNQNRRIGGYIYYTGTEWNIAFAKGITSVTYSLGDLTINHAEIPYLYSADAFGGSVSCRGGVYVPCFGAFGSSSFVLEVRGYDGVKANDTPTTDMKFYVDRHFDGGVRVADIGIASSNIWVYGIFEIA